MTPEHEPPSFPMTPFRASDGEGRQCQEAGPGNEASASHSWGSFPQQDPVPTKLQNSDEVLAREKNVFINSS